MIGRESELAALERWIAGGEPARAAVITGEPGIGKTTLWARGTELARDANLQVLEARGTPSETLLPFVALADLFDGIGREELAGLPRPQLAALEIALLRDEPEGSMPEARAVAIGFLNALRLLATDRPIVLAIDDAPWLDSASTGVLAFASRRLRGLEARFLVTRRDEPPTEFERTLAVDVQLRLELEPLSLGAIRRLVFERLGLRLSRRLQHRIFEASRGNPFYALELARASGDRPDDELAISPELDELLAARVERLPPPVRKLLAAAELAGELSPAIAGELAGRAAVDEALAQEVLEVDRDRLQPAHPLLGAAARASTGQGERNALHAELAQLVEDDDLRVRHLALATAAPDAALAAQVAEAAARASVRGAPKHAAELAGEALRLTPPDAPEAPERLLDRARHLLNAGELEAVTELLSGRIESLPTPELRARGLLLLADSAAVSTTSEYLGYVERALEEAAIHPALTAAGLWRRAEYFALGQLERLADAERWSAEALGKAAGDREATGALATLGWAKALRGNAVDGLLDADTDGRPSVYRSISRIAAVRHGWRGEVEQARLLFDRLVAEADEQGDDWSYSVLRLNLCELELRAGEWSAVDRMISVWDESREAELLLGGPSARLRALAAAGRGRPEDARRWAPTAIAEAEEGGILWDLFETRRALGLAALAAHDPPAAVAELQPVWEHTVRQGIEDPGAFPVAPELVESLVEAGEPDAASAVAARLEDLARGQAHPWGLATSKRCNGLIGLAERRADAAAELLAAAEDYGRLGLTFDRARALLGAGRGERRLRRWADARSHLEAAADAFDAIGSTGWAEEARAELGRISARKPARSGELTPSEFRVAQLAAEGRSNKEIAQELFVTVNTVEAHLTRVYAKLGIRSRGQLAQRLR